MREQQPRADRPGRVGGPHPEGGRTSGGQDDRAGSDDGAVVEGDAHGPAGGGEDLRGAAALQHGDPLMLGGQRRELADDPAPGGSAAGVDDPARRVTALEAQGQPAGAVGVEGHAELGEILHRRRGLVAEHSGGRLAHRAAPGGERVGQVALGAVVVGQRRGEPALGPVAGGAGQGAGRDEGHRARRHAPPAAPCRARPRLRRRRRLRSGAGSRAGTVLGDVCRPARASAAPILARPRHRAPPRAARSHRGDRARTVGPRLPRFRARQLTGGGALGARGGAPGAPRRADRAAVRRAAAARSTPTRSCRRARSRPRCTPAGAPCRWWTVCWTAGRPPGSPSTGRPGTTPRSSARWASACSTTSPSRRATPWTPTAPSA